MNIHDMICGVISREGGYTDNPKDKGGATNFGITQKTLSTYLSRPVTKDEIRVLSKDLAYEIYEKNYFVVPRLNTLPDSVQCQALDICVNSGQRTSIRLIQRVINKAGFGPIPEDGVLGPTTRAKTFQCDNDMGKFFPNALVDERIIFYKKIVASDDSQAGFLDGWINRAESFRI